MGAGDTERDPVRSRAETIDADAFPDMARADVDGAASEEAAMRVPEARPLDDRSERRFAGGLVSPLARAIALAQGSVAESAWTFRAQNAPDAAGDATIEARRATRPGGDRGAHGERDVGRQEPARQLLLDLSPRPGRRAERVLVSETNQLAVDLVEAPDRWRAGFACLVGPEASGKTHIVRRLHPSAVWARREDCADRGRLDGFLRDHVREGAVLAFDALDAAFGRPDGEAFELGLFHLLNCVADHGARLLATARAAPSRWRVALPDLRTRLDAATLATIEPPDDVLLTALLMKLFDDRGIEVESAVLGYLVKRMERSYAAAAAIVERLNAVSLEEKRAVTTPLAASALGWRPSRF